MFYRICINYYNCDKNISIWRSRCRLSLLMCVILFVGGVQLFCMGILGKYLSKTYLETKKRPIYLVKEENIDEK